MLYHRKLWLQYGSGAYGDGRLHSGRVAYNTLLPILTELECQHAIEDTKS